MVLERARGVAVVLTALLAITVAAGDGDIPGAPASEWGEGWAPPPSRETTLRVEVPDGLVLEGLLVLPDRGDPPAGGYPLALLLHSFGRSRDGLLPLADELAAAGIASALVDMRGHGSSRTTASGAPYVFDRDLSAILRHAITDGVHVLKAAAARPEIDAGRVAVVGVGEGGLIAASIAARMPRARALVLVDPSREGAGVDLPAELEGLGSRPALVVCSGLATSQRYARKLGERGEGPREVRCVNAFAEEERLLGYGQQATREVVTWLASRW
jgi:pimeloyl-ACP methyl ester carboxylesterase